MWRGVLTAVMNPLGELTTTSYDVANRPIAMTDGEGQSHDHQLRPGQSLNRYTKTPWDT